MILVTGASGYVGGYVIEALKQVLPAQQIRGMARGERGLNKLRQWGIQAAQGDVTERASLDAALQGVQKVIHLAAVNRDKGPVTMQRVNAEGSIALVDAAKAAGVAHIITVVGLGADSKRPYPLAQTQGRGVEYLIASGVAYTVLEASVIFGAGDEFLNTFAGLAGIPPVMVVPGDGQSKFQPIAVQDVAECAVKSLTLPQVINKRLQICGSEVLTLEQIEDAIMAEMGVKRTKINMPVPLLKIGVGVMGLLPKPPVTSSLLAQLGVDNIATDNATEKVFGLTPRKLRENIGFVREMTAGKFIQRTLGRLEYR